MRCPICGTEEFTSPESGDFYVMTTKGDEFKELFPGLEIKSDTFCMEPEVEAFHCRGGHHFYIPKKFL